MAWIGAAIGAGAGIIGNMMQSDAQSAANASNANLNERNIAWQTQMRDTAMQSRVEDLKKAGLNPMLAVNGSGAAQPGASMIPAQSTGQAWGNLGAQVSGAMQLRTQQAQIDNLNAAARNQDTQAATNKWNLQNTLPAQIDKLRADTGLSVVQAEQVGSNIKSIESIIKNNDADTALKMIRTLTEGQSLEVLRGTTQALISSANSDAKAKEYGLTGAKLLSDFQQTAAGKGVFYANQFLEPVATAAGAALGGSGAARIIKGMRGAGAPGRGSFGQFDWNPQPMIGSE